ncbi:TetR-like C-terminal domain-containing protein [Mycolicibacterium sp.]|uniref:TetR-like C-terminal domain-containing protein n=1 Tax=Mycolicibacterium sp. TaxID=2320850 RepID=UPI003D138F6C
MGHDADESDRAGALHAALAELQQWGMDRFSIDGVALRARLSPEYLRQTWASEHELVMEALRDYIDAVITLPDTGSLRGDLTELALALGAFLNRPDGRRIARMFVIDSRSLVVNSLARSEFWALRKQTIQQVFDRAARRGELRGDVKPVVALQLLTSPLHAVALYTDRPVDPDYCRMVADLVTRAIS